MNRKIITFLKSHWLLILVICILITLGLIAARLIYLHWFGYIIWLPFTGLEDKTLWNVAELLVIPLALVVIAAILDCRERKADREIAKDNQQEAALQNYFDSMTNLILQEKLRESTPEDDVREIAQVKTETTIERLDSSRKSKLVKFLADVGLVNADSNTSPLIFLSHTNLMETNLCSVDLTNASMFHIILNNAYLSSSKLNNANLQFAELRNVKFIKTELKGADLRYADLTGAKYINDALLYSSKYNDRTKWPNGFDPIAAGAIKVDENEQLHNFTN